MGNRGQNDAHRPRPDAGQSAPGGTRLWRGGAGPQRHRRRFSGPAPLDRPLPERRLHGGDPQFVVRLERHPSTRHHGHRERRAQRRVHAHGVSADEHGADFCRRAHLLESRRGQARHRREVDRPRRQRVVASHQFRFGHARRHGPAGARWQTGVETLLGNHQSRGGHVSQSHHLARGVYEYFRGGGFSRAFLRAAACR